MLLLFSFALFLNLGDLQKLKGDLIKCCSGQDVMGYKNKSFICDGTASALENNLIIINSYEPAKRIEYNFCVEVLDQEVFVFKKTKENFLKMTAVMPDFFPKCCPMGYVYNANFHSCEESLLDDENHFGFRYIRVGLPNCRIISDYKSQNLLKKELFNINTDDYCLDNTQDNLQVIRVCTNDYGVCKTTKCIHKCCPDGQSFVNGSFCKPTYTHGVDLNFSVYIDQTDDFNVIHGYSGKIYLQPSDWEFNLDSKGVFRLFDEKIGNEIYGPTEETYCIEHATKNGINFGHRLFRKHPEEPIKRKYIINGYVMIISSVFLSMTIIFYIFSGETKKLFGKTLVSFCVCLLITFSLLIYSTFRFEEIKSKKAVCHTIGFLLVYGEFSTFLWLKLLCFDIYYTFGSGKIRNEGHKTKGIKRFICYSLYGWGLSLLLTSIPISLTYVDVLPAPIQIRMGIYRCSIDRFEDNYADILFRTIPITVIQIGNFVLFIKTVHCCIKVKNEIQKMNANNGQKKMKFLVNKQRFVLVIKLSVVMGISHTFEVVSSFYDFNKTTVTEYVEIVWDVFNCLQGIFIFIIFICKKKMADKIRNHAGIRKLRKISWSSGSTHTTTISLVKEKRRKFKLSKT